MPFINSDHFTFQELACKHCGQLHWTEDDLRALEELRVAFDRPMHLSSAYRCPVHPEEASKPGGGGAHTRCAVDVECSGADAYALIATAIHQGWSGIGVSQKKGSSRFIHLDRDLPRPNAPRPTVWSY